MNFAFRSKFNTSNQTLHVRKAVVAINICTKRSATRVYVNTLWPLSQVQMPAPCSNLQAYSHACLHWHTNVHILKTYHLSFKNESCNNKAAPLPGHSVCTDSRMTVFPLVHFHNKITQATRNKTLATPTTAYYQVIKIVWHSPVICITALLVVYNTLLSMCNRI